MTELKVHDKITGAVIHTQRFDTIEKCNAWVSKYQEPHQIRVRNFPDSKTNQSFIKKYAPYLVPIILIAAGSCYFIFHK